ncbi:MAG: zinc ribbon domain-containing protein [Chloroflexi bacterium]|nr:zinc ribbon domain-containing protein [Chloroflexota bacterium]
MPVYEYRCNTCKTTFELLRPINLAADAPTCPSGHDRVERVVSLIAARAGAGGLDEAAGGGGCGSCAGGSCACGGH